MGHKHVSFDGERAFNPIIKRKREGLRGRKTTTNESESEKKKRAVLREEGRGRTGFHPATCSSFHMPGMLVYPPARASMNVASVMTSVPGTLVRCL
jgi:hypothetical protein